MKKRLDTLIRTMTPYFMHKFYPTLLLSVIASVIFYFPVSEAVQPGTVVATFEPADGGFYYNPPTLSNGYIFIGTSHKLYRPVAKDNRFYKLDKDLNVVWSFSLGEAETRGSAVLDSKGNIYFVAETGKIYSNGILDQTNLKHFLYSLGSSGNLRWQKDISAVGWPQTGPVYGMITPAVSVQDTIYVGRGKLYAFDSNGNEKWTFTTGGTFQIYGGETFTSDMDIRNAPAIDDQGNIYFNALDHQYNPTFFSVNPGGELRWKWSPQFSPSSADDYVSSPAFSKDGSQIYFVARKQVYCFNTTNGELIWRYIPEGLNDDFVFSQVTLRATPAVDDNDNVYIGLKANQASIFYAIKNDGTGLLWQNPIGADLYSSPAIGNDRVIYVGSEKTNNGQFHALDMQTGSTLWSLNFGADVVWSSPVISDDGRIYVATMAADEEPRGRLYAVQTQAGGLLKNAGSPRFHGGNENTGRRLLARPSQECNASLSSDGVLHIPSLNFYDHLYSINLQIRPATFDVDFLDYEFLTDVARFRDCTSATLSADLRIHIPALLFNGISYWATMRHQNDLTFQFTGAGQN